MKIVQSFWFGNQTDFQIIMAGILDKHHWMSWILSCHQLVKHHKEVELYTDCFGYEILITKLQLPYTKVHVVLDELNHYNKNLWAIAKLELFNYKQNLLFTLMVMSLYGISLIDKFENCNLITQNLEVTTDYYRERWNVIFPQLSFLPNEMINYHENKSNLACNMGIIGGRNLDFFKVYTQKSVEFVDKNNDRF